MLLGSRVVHGPDWKTRNNSESVEKGFIGTIINLHHFQDGTPLPEETVLVHWDTGKKSCCRAGQDGYYDLRILDSAPAGVKFKGFCCDGCQEVDIAGMRWQCAVCPKNIVLCTSCYMNDMHYTDHRFVRFNTPSDKYSGVEVGERSTSFKIQSRGIFPGAKVRTKRDMECSWTSPVLIGGDVLDIMTWDHIPRSTVLVKWGEFGEQICRLGYEGEVDLELIEHEFAHGPYFYPNHLPMVSVGAHLRLISKIVSCKKNSRKEIMDEGENAIKYLDELLSECDHESKAMLCRIKREIQEQQHAIDMSENIQKLASMPSQQENEQTENFPCNDTMEYQSISASGVFLEINSFQDANHSFAITDEVDSGSVNKSQRVANIISKFSIEDGQEEVPPPGNERKEDEVSEVRQNVSWIIHKFEKMTSSSMPNMHHFVPRAPFAASKVTTALSQDMKQGSRDDASPSKEKVKKEKIYSKPYLSKSGNQQSTQRAPYVAENQLTTPSEEKVKKEKIYSKPYLSKPGNQTSTQHAPYVAENQLTTPSEEKVKKEKIYSKPYLSKPGNQTSTQHAPYVAENQLTTPSEEKVKKEKIYSKPYLSKPGNQTSTQNAPYVAENQLTTPSEEKVKKEKIYSKPYLSKSGNQQSTQRAPYVTENQLTTPSEKKVKKEKIYSKPYLSKPGNQTSTQHAPYVTGNVICSDAASTISVTASSRKPILPNKKSMHRGFYATEKVPTIPSESNKQENFDVTTTLHKVKPKKENSELEAKSEDICANAKYVSNIVRRFEDLAK